MTENDYKILQKESETLEELYKTGFRVPPPKMQPPIIDEDEREIEYDTFCNTYSFNVAQMKELTTDKRGVEELFQLYNLAGLMTNCTEALFFEMEQHQSTWKRREKALRPLLFEMNENFSKYLTQLNSNMLGLDHHIYKEKQELISSYHLVIYLIKRFQQIFAQVFAQFKPELQKYFSGRELEFVLRNFKFRFRAALQLMAEKYRQSLQIVCRDAMHEKITETLELDRWKRKMWTYTDFWNQLKMIMPHFDLFDPYLRIEFPYKATFIVRRYGSSLVIRLPMPTCNMASDYFILINPLDLLELFEQNVLWGRYAIYFHNHPDQLYQLNRAFPDRIKIDSEQIMSPKIYYNRTIRSQNDKDKIAIVDLETTGLTEHDLIVELSIVELNLQTGVIKRLLNAVVKPAGFEQRHFDAYIFSVSPLKPKDVNNAIPLDVYLPAIQQILDGYYITSFNTRFDFGFLERAGLKVSNKLPCVMLRSMPILNIPSDYYGTKYPSLKEAYAFFLNKALENQHTSMADAIACAEIVYEMSQKNGYPSLDT